MSKVSINHGKVLVSFIFLPLLMDLFYIQKSNINIAYFVLIIQCISFILCIKEIKVNFEATQMSILVLLYTLFTIAVFSSLFSDYKIQSIKISFLVFVPSIFLFLLTISDNEPKKTFLQIFEVLMRIGLVLALIAIILFLFGKTTYTNDGKTIQFIKIGTLRFYQRIMGAPPYYRVSSLTANPNTLGLILMLSQMGTIYLYNINVITRKNFAVSYLIQIIGLLLTQSRGSILTSIIMVILFSILMSNKRSHRRRILFTTTISFLGIYYIIDAGYLGILFRFQGGLTNRNLAWRLLKQQIVRNPFLGVGFGVSSEMILYNLGIKAHNVFLNCIAEIGLIGFFLFISVWLFGLVCSFLEIKRNRANQKQKCIYVLIFSILFSLIFHQMVENKLLVYDFTMFLWIYLISFSTIKLDNDGKSFTAII